MRRTMLLLAVVALGGCKATIPNDTFACTTDDQCPAGFVCAGGFCSDTPSGADAGGADAGPATDAGADAGAGRDAGPVDAGDVDAGDVDAGPGTDAGADAGVAPDGGGTETSMAECSDGADNDGDGDTDCEDPGCCGSGACTPGLLACDCPALAARTAVTVSGTIAADTEWTCDHTYTLNGVVNVEGADLTVRPGTMVLAEIGAGLFVERDARLLAVGSEARPIHFTSARPVGSRAPGDWYGVFLFGQAPINDPAGSSVIPGFPADVVTFGGTDPAHDCGHLEYVNSTFGGQDQNVNLALIACGTGTRVHYVHTSYSEDTNFYVGGGTVAIDHVGSFRAGDEGFMYSEGWVGSAQFVFVGAAGGAGLRGRTSFVDGARTPFSTPAIWNATIGGTLGSVAAVDLISGAGLHMGNSILTGVASPGPCFSADASAEPRIVDDLDIRHSILWDCAGTMGFAAGTEASRLTDFSVFANRFVDPMLSVATPPPGSPPTTGATTPPAGLAPTTYLGAFAPAPAGTPDWSDAWADYRPN